jgi:hypothetical protein
MTDGRPVTRDDLRVAKVVTEIVQNRLAYRTWFIAVSAVGFSTLAVLSFLAFSRHGDVPVLVWGSISLALVAVNGINLRTRSKIQQWLRRHPETGQ